MSVSGGDPVGWAPWMPTLVVEGAASAGPGPFGGRLAETMTTGGMHSPEHLDFPSLFDDAVTGMAIVGLDGRFQAVNPALCRMLGFAAEEIVGLRTADVTHPGDRARCMATLDQLIGGEARTDQVNKRYVRADGSTVWAVRTTTVLRGGDGAAIGLFTQVVDVTASTEMREEIARSEQRFKALVAHASDLIVLLDHSGRIRYASPAAGRVLGYSPEQLEGCDALGFVHPDDQEAAASRFVEQSATAGPRSPARYRVRHHTNDWRDVEVVTTNLLDDPTVAALVLNVRDVTEQTEYQRRLEAGERRFRALVDKSWDIITLHDADGRYLFCSPAVARLGYDADEMVGESPFELIHPDDRDAVRRVFAEAAGQELHPVAAEYRFRHCDGTWRWLESIAERRDDPAIAAVVVTTRDVTQRRHRARQQQAVAEIGQSALRDGPLENLLERIPAVVTEALAVEHCHVVRAGPDGTRAVVASAGAGGWDVSADDDGCPVCVDALERRAPCVWDCDRDDAGPSPAAGRRHGVGAAVPVTPAGGTPGALAVWTADPDGFGSNDVAFLETVASILAAAISRRSVEAQLRRQAVHDELTDLPNRVLLQDRLGAALTRLGRRGGSVAVLFVDVDNFKLINDTLGHTLGDSVVAAVAARLRAAVRAPDTVARFGGDEFVVVGEDADDTVARRLADRIRQELAAPITIAGKAITVTASIGCVTTSDPAASPDSVMADADMAMYEAKRAGKNSVAVFTPELRRRTTDHLETVSGIRRGLGAGEFRLHFQPIVDLTTGRTHGHEALLRWDHPSSGLLLPAQFIDYAETSGLIVPLGRWVLDTGCVQSAVWRRAGRPSQVSMNVSGWQLTGSDIVADVAAALEASGADPADVDLEVTESALISDLDQARRALGGLRDLGVGLGLDDFGTGWSSLSQLARLPFDFVKIDRSFVRDLETDHRTAALLESILMLCSTLALDVIVEGVETVSQLDHLEELGVRWVQGFLLGRPVPPALVDSGPPAVLACHSLRLAGRRVSRTG